MFLIEAHGEHKQHHPPACIVGGGTVVLPDGLLDSGNLLIEDGKISKVTTHITASHQLPFIDAKGGYIAPGFIELHIHGCGEYQFEALDASRFNSAADYLLSQGITTFCPTVQSSEEAIGNLGTILQDPNNTDTVPGIYVEGPFVNQEKRGGILPEHIRAPDLAYFDSLIRLAQGTLRVMTIAPELPGSSELFRRCREAGVIPCFGHSASDTDTALRVVRELSGDANRGGDARVEGACLGITHLFNGMSSISHKQSGLAALPFLSREPFVELNSDGVHVNRETLQLCYTCLDHERLILISDAVVTAGLSQGSRQQKECTYFGKPVVSDENGVRYRDSGVLIGSNLLIPDVLKQFMRLTGAPLHKAVRFVTLNPARFLGIDAHYGSIEPGKTANLVFLDRDLRVIRVLKSG